MNPQWIYVYMDFVLLPNPIKLRQIEFFTIGLYSEGYDDWIIFVVVQHFRCRKICQIVCRVHRKWMESKFLHQDVDDEVFLANKGTVIVCFVDRNDKKILIETGKLIDNIRVTKNGLDLMLTECFSRRSLRFTTSPIDFIHSERVSSSTSNSKSLLESCIA